MSTDLKVCIMRAHTHTYTYTPNLASLKIQNASYKLFTITPISYVDLNVYIFFRLLSCPSYLIYAQYETFLNELLFIELQFPADTNNKIQIALTDENF